MKLQQQAMIDNEGPWTDADGQPIHAHGGGMLEVSGWYYWLGEDRRERVRVSCYRSRNLVDWEFRGHVLTLDSPFQPLYRRTSLLSARVPLALSAGTTSESGLDLADPAFSHDYRQGADPRLFLLAPVR
ncbi:hypothetical protein [Paenibacillus donghaensis]|uniref:Glycosyl hydrolase family 32 N-terminal domain-containing protein n=1 Tax=Paenibacillus donghaensis TaxID=414771 RepID=A0A2Z2K6D1_9BACL|nr:hypothetical protein [Paenibacillus donghaensis]ASA20317.1 hypothetical protein B9T62_05585 [Paenibacillus donghaensis]